MIYAVDPIWIAEHAGTVAAAPRAKGGKRRKSEPQPPTFHGAMFQAVALAGTGRLAYFRSEGGVPVIDVSGFMRFNDDYYGSVNTPLLCEKIRQAADEPGKKMVLRCNSPGGDIAGLADVKSAIDYARSKKTVEAFVYELAGSMACVLALMCDKVVVTPTARMGAVGSIITLVDCSEANAKAGIKIFRIAAPKGKANLDGSNLSPEAIANLQACSDKYFGLMCEYVAKTSGLTAADIETLDAGIFVGADCITKGLADQVVDADAYLGSLSGSQDPEEPGEKDTESEDEDPAGEDDTEASDDKEDDEPAGEDDSAEDDDDEEDDEEEDDTPSGRMPAAQPKGSPMPPLADLKKKDPAAYNALMAEARAEAGKQAEAQALAPATAEVLLAEFRGQGTEGMAFVGEALDKKMTFTGALKEWATRQTAKATEASTKLETAAKISDLPKGSGITVSPGGNTNPGEESKSDFPSWEAAVNGLVKAEGLSRPDAIMAVQKRYPKLVKDMLVANVRKPVQLDEYGQPKL